MPETMTLPPAIEAGLAELARLTTKDPQAQERIDRARGDIPFFESYYLPQYFSHPAGSFHAQLDTFLRRPGHCAVEAPRGHGKSVKITLSFLLHAILYREARYILLVSETYEKASAFLQFIRFELEENERIRSDFGDLRGPDWTDRMFTTSTEVCLRAYGEGQKVRGSRYRQYRPDLIVIDDPESNETTQSAVIRRKRQAWFKQEVLGAVDRDGRVVLIGTCVHYDCLVRHAAAECGFPLLRFKAVINWPTRMDLWEECERRFHAAGGDQGGGLTVARAYYRKLRGKMDAGAKVLWPEYWDVFRLMLRKFSMGGVAFAQEFQNEAIDPSAQRFREEWITYWTEADIADVTLAHFMAVDPSLGRSDQSDFSAVLVGGVHPKTKRLILRESVIERMNPGDLIACMFRLAQKWNVLKVGIESNQFQVLLADALRKKSQEAGAFLPVQEITNVADKVLRITSISPLIEHGDILFRKEDQALIQQLIYFPKADHDDGPDALEMLVRVARSGGKVEFKSAGSTRVGADVPDYLSDTEDMRGYDDA